MARTPRLALTITSILLGAACEYVHGFIPAPTNNAAQRNTRQRTQSHHKIRPELRSATSQETPTTAYPSDWQSQILSALSVIIDPDLDADIVTLGFVQNLQIDDSSSSEVVVSLDLELTTPACPVKDSFVQQCNDILNGFEWIASSEVSLTSRPNQAPSGSPLGMSQIGSIIAVSSCKGGVGKSTTAVNLAYALRSQGAAVGIFDADVYGPSLPTMIAPDDDAVRFVGRQIAPLKRDNVSLMSFGYVNDGSAIMRGPMVTQLLDQFLSLTNWGPLDYLILDMPPGTGDIQLTLCQKLNITAAVIVTTPQELSFVDVERGVEMFDTVNVPCVAVVENMAYFENEDGGQVQLDEEVLKAKFVEALESDGLLKEDAKVGDVADELVKIVQQNAQRKESEKIRIFGKGHKRRLSEQWGIEHTYSVPLLGKIAQNGDSGTPFIVENPDSPQAEIYRELARSVVGEVAKFKFGKSKYSRPNVSYDEDNGVIRVSDNDTQEEEGTTIISPADLRRGCRCAACVEEMTGKQILDPASVSESIRPLDMSPTGNYALSVDWSDGHRSLYPYRQVRSMIEEKQQQKQQAPNEKETVQA